MSPEDRTYYSNVRLAAKEAGWTSVVTLKTKCPKCGLREIQLNHGVSACPDVFLRRPL